MIKSPFIWLGSGRARRRGVARCGEMLDTAARAGLPVPDGAILLDELFRIYLKEGIVEQIEDKVVIPDPIWLLEVLYRDVRFPRLRAAADLTPIPSDNHADPLPPEASVCAVDLEDARGLAGALSRVWAYPLAGSPRRDILLTEALIGQTTGRALSLPSTERDRILVAGGDQQPPIDLPRLGRWQRPLHDLPPFARRLQMLLRGLRRTLGRRETLDFYWIDDGQVSWIKRFN